ncbi:AAA family ATPase [Lysinibacillus fusiformis]|uniref:AAA family ATPase n=1 Tax=Lysinibacillus fusiformis TaxID=28031 RepID=UPI0023A915F5|nr:AAA family ATPase [Lysinibacillus fusiformis]WEA38043.1 AAA family ATPase [Lysinibacillus fusiformis]
MNKYYLTKVNINNVRNLKNLEIHLSNENKVHLIITGRNGSGKTSVLEGIAENLSVLERSSITSISDAKRNIEIHQNSINKLEKDRNNHSNNESIDLEIKKQDEYIYNNKFFIDTYEKKVSLKFNRIHELDDLYRKGKFIVVYFNASRITKMIEPNGIEKVDIQEKYSPLPSAGEIFVKYLVDLKAQEMFSSQAGDIEESNKIKRWFDFLEKSLQDVFESPRLKLIFNYKEYNFEILEPGKLPYTLNTLSSGYSSILNVVTEIIIRMEKNKKKNYDVQGIVIIDEIEAHLHLSLQKKIFKFLTDFFPNIQFIVSSHSPFVLNSVENAVVYDIETSTQLEDLSAYSYKSILEGYFGVDQYSSITKQNVKRYKYLSQLDGLSHNENLEFEELKQKFENVSEILPEELKLELALTNLNLLLGGSN